MTHPSQEAVEVDDFEVLICEVTKQLHVGTINAYEANKKLIGAYNKVRATFAQTIREEECGNRNAVVKEYKDEGAMFILKVEDGKTYEASMPIPKWAEVGKLEYRTPTTNHTGDANP